MPIAKTNGPTSQTPLRLWPGVVTVVLQWLLRFGVPIVAPGAIGYGGFGGLLGGLAIVVWWAFFSRAPRAERWRAGGGGAGGVGFLAVCWAGWGWWCGGRSLAGRLGPSAGAPWC